MVKKALDTQANQGTLHRPKIFIADDDPAIVDSMQMMLELEGFAVTTIVDGKTIYNMKGDYPDVLLLDIWMSGEDGRDICKYLKSDPQTSHIPVIMISASKDVELSAKNAGADDFIAKPFEMVELVNMIRKYTKNRMQV